MASKLSGKACIVTGGSRGIGRGLCLGLAAEGAKIVFTYKHNQSAAEETLQLLQNQHAEVIMVQCDVTSSEDREALIVRALEAFGGIDVLVNNAGIVSRCEFMEIREEEFDNVMATNVKAPYFLTQAVSAQMIKQGRGGSIINVSSISAQRTWATYMSAYECSKAAVTRFSKSLATTLAPHKIRINILSPGLTDTDMADHAQQAHIPPIQERAEKLVPMKRPGQPSDYVGMVVFMASDESEWMTGTDVIIDGGSIVG